MVWCGVVEEHFKIWWNLQTDRRDFTCCIGSGVYGLFLFLSAHESMFSETWEVGTCFHGLQVDVGVSNVAGFGVYIRLLPDNY